MRACARSFLLVDSESLLHDEDRASPRPGVEVGRGSETFAGAEVGRVAGEKSAFTAYGSFVCISSP